MSIDVNLDDLSDSALNSKYNAVLKYLGTIENVDSRLAILSGILDALDYLDQDDAFGTEGWQVDMKKALSNG